ncbi:MAG TPA: phage tail sheath subtilisin-like domain-containing protein [Flavobacteriaceae bacterium]|mgnify:CR=1 FL=1|nr:phage tail sheath family protein [Flavobacteriaceae bacterium]MCB9214027.1 phage tail sheath family protein [Alteromonas sp.]HPF10828.1 phage tail sheath subtilisin-like domain-containing protein [Flavobacteriaceae bacterium]HQU20963.1 phage tail sheath subtilisin-like domain-containing protein [Flavobacteriaceae bacterium]HQU65548.1 phage tail sheath subtilisin-like domain-containing protein [Flavobacteriaceae bacterium]
MNELMIKSPGVYINEVNAFPNSVVPVATAVPAFIGYTPQAMYEGKSYTNVPTKISTFADFQAIFCYPNPPAPASPAKQYSPEYYLVKQKSRPDKGDYLQIAGDYYSIVPDPNTIYYMYNSIRLFYENGGGDAYIVSVGTYGAPSKNPMTPGDQIVNPNVELDDLMGGVALLKNEEEPTMYICPEATLLSLENNATLMQSMLLQNMEMGTAVSIFDVIGGRDPDPIMFMNDIENFRNGTGSQGLNFGTAYYPFIGTTIMQNTDIDYTNLFGGDVKQLAPILNPPSAPNQSVATILNTIENPGSTDLTVTQLNNALTNASKTYSTIVNHVLSDANTLPPSGAMAGVITVTDNEQGVWVAPANTSIVGAASLPIRLSESQQGGLNMDPVSGKSINAIRSFNGLGILVWGARTLDGNSLDWKYLPVRRTLIFLEVSCKLAAQAYVFAPNVKNTWEGVKAMIGSFLTSVWKQGGLQGATPADAFSVECGLGSTMTAEDLLLGFMRVSVKVAVVHPAEFIIITFEQQMATSS